MLFLLNPWWEWISSESPIWSPFAHWGLEHKVNRLPRCIFLGYLPCWSLFTGRPEIHIFSFQHFFLDWFASQSTKWVSQVLPHLEGLKTQDSVIDVLQSARPLSTLIFHFENWRGYGVSWFLTNFSFHFSQSRLSGSWNSKNVEEDKVLKRTRLNAQLSNDWLVHQLT